MELKVSINGAENQSMSFGSSTTNILPNGDAGTNMWITAGTCSGGHYDCIDEASGSEDTNNYLEGGNGYGIEEFEMENPSFSGTATQIDVKIYAAKHPIQGCDDLEISIDAAGDGTFESSETITSLTSSAAWHTATFTGSWNDLSSLEIKFDSDVGSCSVVYVYSMYAEVTYT